MWSQLSPPFFFFPAFPFTLKFLTHWNRGIGKSSVGTDGFRCLCFLTLTQLFLPASRCLQCSPPPTVANSGLILLESVVWSLCERVLLISQNYLAPFCGHLFTSIVWFVTTPVLIGWHLCLVKYFQLSLLTFYEPCLISLLAPGLFSVSVLERMWQHGTGDSEAFGCG